ncbi:oxygen-independent coproporphyrinogen III oxidase [Plautia stali symbiont]|nr:oxygen-independent coproporphyrinogen III oxidase [Plautia stali symbiont]
MLGDSYAQNQKELKAWYASVEQQGHALWRGLTLSEDDCLRRDVIKALLCNFALDFADIEARWPVVFERYFAEDLALLAPLVADGLLEIGERRLQVTGCMCFDRYLRQKARMQQFSRVI